LKEIIVRKLLEIMKEITGITNDGFKKLAKPSDNFDVSFSAFIVEFVKGGIGFDSVFNGNFIAEVIVVKKDAGIGMSGLRGFGEREIIRDVLAKTLDFCNDRTTTRNNREDVPTAGIGTRKKLHRLGLRKVDRPGGLVGESNPT
jgi:hypothetical protein